MNIAVAYHEAGHAVVAYWTRVGIGRKGVTIIPDRLDGSAGAVWTKKGFSGDPTVEMTPGMRCGLERKIVVCLAGVHAQRKYRPTSVRSHHGGGDRRNAYDLLSRLVEVSSNEFIPHNNLLDLRAKNFVDAHWREIVAVANALLEKRTLTPGEVREAICSAHPSRNDAPTISTRR